MAWFKKIFLSKRKKVLSFTEKFRYFQELVEANDRAHQAMSEMGEMIVQAEPFSHNYADKVYFDLVENTRIIIENLILISGGKFQTLRKKLEHIENVAEDIFHPKYLCPESFDCSDTDCDNCPKRTFFPENIPYYYDIAEINKSKYLEVGDKMSRLGEIRNVLSLPVPDGFSLTVRLFEEVLYYNNLRERKDKLITGVDYSVIAQIRRAVKETKNLFLWNPLPQHLRNIIIDAYNKKYGDKNIKLAVRSSALGEDSGKYSFAGLHHTELNITRDKFVDAVYQVLISKYSPESVVYRFINGLRDEDMPMSVCCLEMVNTVAAGVLFTADPNGKKQGMIIQAVRGLGILVVEGRVTPQEYIVEHNENANIISYSDGSPSHHNFPNRTEKKYDDTSADNRESPCLSKENVKTLIKYALKIEKHFGCPQDIEWALDNKEDIYIIQARPLNIKKKDYPIAKDFNYDAIDKKYPILLTQGETASPGIAAGPVRLIDSPEDFINFSKNGIIVAKKNIPEFASLIHKASAVITDLGSTTGHLSIIAREFGVPILTNTYNASDVLKDGTIITVDTVARKVYKGAVDELIKFKEECESNNPLFRSSPLYNIWHRLSKYIFKLNLYNPDARNFNALGCETLHDIIRFSHESAIRLMFGTSQSIGPADRGKIFNLRFGLPLDIYVIDLKDGLKDGIKTDWVTTDDIISKPFRALLKGMNTPGLKWTGYLPIDTKGFFSIIAGNIVDESRNDSEIGAKSYALISENYFNFFSRLGYHFSRIDCFASDESNSNYINFNFRGGAADMTRKVRRITAIKLILEHYGFSTDVHDDNVIARIRKIPKRVTYEYVEMLGRLMGSIRNTDVSMVTNRQVELFVKYFLEGDPIPGLRLADFE
jgi:pyruvate,water dikinase